MQVIADGAIIRVAHAFRVSTSLFYPFICFLFEFNRWPLFRHYSMKIFSTNKMKKLISKTKNTKEKFLDFISVQIGNKIRFVRVEFVIEIVLFRCPPCRGFTPILIEFYKSYAEEKNLEIIFISSDRNKNAFEDYYKEMPWLTLDYEDRKKKDDLTKQYQITGIPTLILFDGDSGEILCQDARDEIQHKDTKGERFPWKSS